MNSKSIFYLFFIVVGSFSISIFLRSKYSVEEGKMALEFITMNSLKLILVPVFLLFIFDPLIFLFKRYVRKLNNKSPKGWLLIESLVESLFAYWVIYALIFFFFLEK